MAISLPATMPSAANVDAGSYAALVAASPGDAGEGNFGRLLPQWPGMAGDAGMAMSAAEAAEQTAIADESGAWSASASGGAIEADTETDIEAELPGMAAPMLAMLLNLPQPVPPAASFTTDISASSAAAEPDAVHAARMAPASRQPVELQAAPLAAHALNRLSPAVPAVAVTPATATAPAPVTASGLWTRTAPAPATTPAAAAPASPQPGAVRTASAAIADAPAQSGERGTATVASAPAWSAPAVHADAAAAPIVRLTGASSQWQQPLRQALGEQLQVHVERGSEQAVIRLSPPMLGRIEISIRHEAGVLQVHMSATNHEVLRQLQGIGDVLRQDLSQRQYNEVAVAVAPHARHGEGEGRQRQGSEQREQAPGRALAETDQSGNAFALLTDSE